MGIAAVNPDALQEMKMYLLTAGDGAGWWRSVASSFLEVSWLTKPTWPKSFLLSVGNTQSQVRDTQEARLSLGFTMFPGNLPGPVPPLPNSFFPSLLFPRFVLFLETRLLVFPQDQFLSLRDPATSAFYVAVTTVVYHHTWLKPKSTNNYRSGCLENKKTTSSKEHTHKPSQYLEGRVRQEDYKFEDS